ncbi:MULTISPECIES: hypothetical protein [unclassified Leeuwenhoekiella]|uniref:hypothetical protein n=1 Tax=unclassified Leeuwenhoekiella TaxID=2615029 RepID=UPI000C634CC7|nr:MULTISPECIES: hypothetical protein [unclassified Leeuwenhoekiella]MAW95307.1 hypothetical protein [Leeuwenhoekiella sp.]MBA81769.1 hypothetical protein [Leeuwenhoekiella sp.]|tara:strand:+ start:22468 stop:24387 length:1920 start_codon:yes stop_codon:yes gene_type:complete
MKPVFFTACTLLVLLACDPKSKPETTSYTQTDFKPETAADSIEVRIAPDHDYPHPEVITVYDKLNFGNGYNSTTGKTYFGVMEFAGSESDIELMAGAKGNRGEVTMEILESKEDLKKSLNVTAEAELDMIIYGITSKNSLKLKTVQDTEFSDFSQHAVIKARYVNEPLVLINPRVKQELIDLAQSDPETFIRTCGDMFVSRIYTGGELYSVFSLSSQDSNEKTQNELFFKSANTYLTTSFTASIDASTVNEKIKNTKNIKTSVITEGGGRTPDGLELTDYLKYAADFKEQVGADQRAVILYVELSPYESIAGFPKLDFSKIRVVQKQFLDLATNLVSSMTEDKNTAEFVAAHTELFTDEDSAQSQAVIANYPENKNLLARLIADCRADPDYCDFKDLQVFAEYEPYNPQIDFPEWQGEQTTLPLKEASGWVTLTENTQDGRILSINGDFELRQNTTDSPDCRALVYRQEIIPFGQQMTEEGGFWWWQNAVYRSVFLRFWYPYYEVRYLSLETGDVVKTFNYSGPVQVEPNKKVQIRLRNPDAELVYKSGSKYNPIGEKAEKQLKYKRTPRMTIVENCDPALKVTAVIAAKNAKPKAHVNSNLMTSVAAEPRRALPSIKWPEKEADTNAVPLIITYGQTK